MNKLVNFFLLELIFIFFISSPAFSNDCNAFTEKDVVSIKTDFIQKSINLKEGGILTDFKNLNPTNGFLKEKIRSQGSDYIFKDKKTYNFFIKYLKKIEHNPCAYKEKLLDFHTEKAKYTFIWSTFENEVTISILIKNKVDYESSDYNEESFIYSFEKINNIWYLSRMNAMG